MRFITDEEGFIYLGFYVTFNTVQVISRWVVGRAEETSTYGSLGFCTVNCRPTASNYQLSHMSPCRESNSGLRGGRRECYHSATVAPKEEEGFGNQFECCQEPVGWIANPPPPPQKKKQQQNNCNIFGNQSEGFEHQLQYRKERYN